jgi:hypothetical protein
LRLVRFYLSTLSFSMKTINEIRQSGSSLTRFESFCGGLVAPECVKVLSLSLSLLTHCLCYVHTKTFLFFILPLTIPFSLSSGESMAIQIHLEPSQCRGGRTEWMQVLTTVWLYEEFEGRKEREREFSIVVEYERICWKDFELIVSSYFRGTIKIIPYQNIFTRIERLEIPGHGSFEVSEFRIVYLDQSTFGDKTHWVEEKKWNHFKWRCLCGGFRLSDERVDRVWEIAIHWSIGSSMAWRMSEPSSAALSAGQVMPCDYWDFLVFFLWCESSL